MMLKALPLVHFWSVLLLKEQMMTSVRKTLKRLVWSVQNRLISSEIWPQNRRLFGEVCPENSREIGRFFSEFVPKNPAKFDKPFASAEGCTNFCPPKNENVPQSFSQRDKLSPSAQILAQTLVFDHSSVSGAFLHVFHYRQNYLVIKANSEGLQVSFMQDLVDRPEPHPYCPFAQGVGLGRGWRFCKRGSLRILDLHAMASL